MQFTKKASLNLSINAIVILILAITMLGLGLAFMRNIFGSATQEFSEVSGTVKKQMIDQMKATTKTVDLSRPKVELKAGESTQVFIGFKNEGNDPRDFRLRDTSSATTLPTALGRSDNCLLEYDSTTSPSVPKQVYLEFKTSVTEVLKGDVVVLPINIKTTSDVDPDTCFYELEIEHCDDLASCTAESVTIELTVDITS